MGTVFKNSSQSGKGLDDDQNQPASAARAAQAKRTAHETFENETDLA